MKTAAELAREVDFLKARIETIEQGLKDLTSVKVSIEDANPGDVLEDGSIVVRNSDGMALVAAPASVEVECQWSKEFSDVFEKLKYEGFNPSQWFIPSIEQLRMAFYSREVRKHFSTETNYWSSDEATSDLAVILVSNSGNWFTDCYFKSRPYRVRPFRLLTHQL